MQLVVHEATILSGDRREAMEKMHSTPAMAGAFAAAVRAKRLLLTHFSRGFGNQLSTCSIDRLGIGQVRRTLYQILANAPASAVRRLSLRAMTTDTVLKHVTGLLETKRLVRVPLGATAIEDARARARLSSAALAKANQGSPVETTIEQNVAALLRLCGPPAAELPSSTAAAGEDTTATVAAAGSDSCYFGDDDSDGVTSEATGASAHRLHASAAATHAAAQAPASGRDSISDPENDSDYPAAQLPQLAEYCYPLVNDHMMCEQLAQAARTTFKRREVLCARDFMTVVIPQESRPQAASAALAAAAAAAAKAKAEATRASAREEPAEAEQRST